MAKEEDPYRYAAFFSYQRKADSRLASALQAALQVFAKPWYRKRAMEVFRDETGLAMTNALWPKLESNLADSEHFVLIASPEAAGSRWVQKEIDWWIKNRSIETLHIVLTDGEVVWDYDAGAFNCKKTTALPDQLAKQYQFEPGYADLRWTRTDSDLTLENSKFRFAVRQVVASLQGKTPEEVYSKEAGALRRNLLWVVSVAVMLFVLSVAAVWAALYANQQTKIAEQRARMALSRALAAESQEVLGGNSALAHLLAVEATRSDDTVEARGALLTALLDRPNLERSLHVFGQPHAKTVSGLAFERDGTTLVVAANNGAVSRWDVPSGLPINPPLRSPQPGDQLVDTALADDGSHFAVLLESGLVQLWRPSDWKPLPPVRTITQEQVRPLFSAKAIAVTPDGKSFAVGYSDGRIEIRNASSGELTAPVFGEPIAREDQAHRIGVQVLDFSADGKHLVSGHGGNAIEKSGAMYKIWSIEEGVDEVAVVPAMGDGARAVTFAPDGGRVYCGRSDGRIDVFALVEQGVVATFEGGAETYVTSVDVGSELLAVTYLDGQVVIWNLASGKIAKQWTTGATHAEVVTLSPSGDRVATGGSDGSAGLWFLDSGALGRLLETGEKQQVPTLLSASADGRWLAAIGNEQVTKWNLSTGLIDAQFSVPERTNHYSVAFDGEAVVVMADVEKVWRCEDGDCREIALQASDTVAKPSATLPLALTKASPWSQALRRTSDVKWSQQTVGVATLDGTLWVTGGRMSAPYTVNLHRSMETDVVDLGLQRSSEWIGGVAVSRDGQIVAVGVGDGRLFFCDAVDGTLLGPPVNAHRGGVVALEFRYDNAVLATGSRDGTVVLWDVETRQMIGGAIAPPVSLSQVFALTFTENGEELAVSYWGGSSPPILKLLDVSVCSWMERALTRANRNLSQGEWRQLMGDLPFQKSSEEAPSPPFE